MPASRPRVLALVLAAFSGAACSASSSGGAPQETTPPPVTTPTEDAGPTTTTPPKPDGGVAPDACPSARTPLARAAKACESFTTTPAGWTLENATVTPQGRLRFATTNPGPTCVATWKPTVKPAGNGLWVAFDIQVDEAIADPQSSLFEGIFEISVSGSQSVSVALSSTLDGKAFQLAFGSVSKNDVGGVGQEGSTVALATGKVVPVFIHLAASHVLEAWADGVKATNDRFAVEWSPEAFSDFRFVMGISPSLSSNLTRATLLLDNLRYDDE